MNKGENHIISSLVLTLVGLISLLVIDDLSLKPRSAKAASALTTSSNHTTAMMGQWTQTNGPYGGNITALLSVSGGNLFAGTYEGVFLTTNNGQSWTAVNNGLTNQHVDALAVSGSNLFAGTYGGGVFLSTNNGQSWTAVNNGLTNLPNQAVLALAVSGGNLFAGTDGDGVFLSTNNGQSWTAVNNGLTNQLVPALAVSGGNLFAGTWGSGVFRGSDFVGAATSVSAASFTGAALATESIAATFGVGL